MTNKIKILSDLVANQIAAGEVVERPASVLKELLENSLDAGANAVDIEILEAGTELIRVTDNGEGMSPDDALLCLERHGTSKINTLEDISKVTTFGFRGEAIPSIAAVSDMKIKTCLRGANCGTEVIVRYGRLLEARECGCPPGTTVEVRRLFHNIPARKKFLKTPATELAHIERLLRVTSLAYPHLAISSRLDGKAYLNWPASSPEQRVAEVLGEEIYENLIPIDLVSAEGWHLKGWASRHDFWHTTREHIHWIVNLRPVNNRALEHALREAYRGGITAGRYPVILLHLRIPPDEVDVNVHPAKLEVRFRHETRLRHWLADALSNALATAPHYDPKPRNHPSNTTNPASTGAPPTPHTVLAHGSEHSVAAELSEAPNLKKLVHPEPVFSPQREPGPPSKPSLATPPPRPANPQSGPLLAKSPQLALPPLPEKDSIAQNLSAPTARRIIKIKLIGQVRGRYWVGETEDGLVLLDQVAAHQRILFERLLKQQLEGGIPGQGLLTPERFTMPPAQAERLRDYLPVLKKAGLVISEFGGHDFLIEAVPPFWEKGDTPRRITALLGDLENERSGAQVRRLISEQLVAKVLCRHLITGVQTLDQREADALLTDLLACQLPYTNPDGRPTMILLTDRDLARRFGRDA